MTGAAARGGNDAPAAAASRSGKAAGRQRSVRAKALSAALSVSVFSYALLPERLSAAHFMQRQRNVTICALVQVSPGRSCVPLPFTMSRLSAQFMAGTA